MFGCRGVFIRLKFDVLNLALVHKKSSWNLALSEFRHINLTWLNEDELRERTHQAEAGFYIPFHHGFVGKYMLFRPMVSQCFSSHHFPHGIGQSTVFFPSFFHKTLMSQMFNTHRIYDLEGSATARVCSIGKEGREGPWFRTCEGGGYLQFYGRTWELIRWWTGWFTCGLWATHCFGQSVMEIML